MENKTSLLKKIKNNQRKIKDGSLNVITYLFSSFEVIILIAIFIFIFSRGFTTLSWKMITGDYTQETYNLKYEIKTTTNLEEKEIKDSYYSTRWGIALKDGINSAHEPVVYISYIDKNSPLNDIVDQTNNEIYKIETNTIISKIILVDENDSLLFAFAKDSAENMVKTMDKGIIINDFQIKTAGGGIRGSLLTTLYLIVITLLIALPLGIGGAIYLAEYAKENKFTTIIRSMIDMTSGIPSIIFGLVGVVIFIPMVNVCFKSNGTSILAGCFTLAIMLLPLIIRTTEEAIHNIPSSYRSASLALGASKTQTIFKIIIPNALSGILTSTLLSIGRIIGESAALIYVMGTAIKDNVLLNSNSTSLAVHMWSVIMAGEYPNYKAACAISIVILITVLILNILVKIISKKLNRFEVK